MECNYIELKPLIPSLICVVPVFWGVYEFRKFRYQLNDIKKTADQLNVKIDDLANNKLDKYPFFADLKILVDKINKVFKP